MISPFFYAVGKTVSSARCKEKRTGRGRNQTVKEGYTRQEESQSSNTDILKERKAIGWGESYYKPKEWVIILQPIWWDKGQGKRKGAKRQR